MSEHNRNPLVSVITASFNALKGLQCTVESVAEQSYRSVEHIIVDGGSTDGTTDYLQSLGDAVLWISEPDGGIADALNKGVAMASGEYILVLQADDTFLDAESLARAECSLRHETEIVSFDVLLTRGDDQARFCSRGLGWQVERFMTVPHQGAFCRRQLFARIGGFDTRYRVALDYDFMLRAKRAKSSIALPGEILSLMPATGISARRDRESLLVRLSENRAIQRRHSTTVPARVVGWFFWLLYRPYKLFHHRHEKARTTPRPQSTRAV